MTSLVVLIVAMSACGSSDDIVGPFTGPIHRFVIDRVAIPRDSNQASALADDTTHPGTARVHQLR